MPQRSGVLLVVALVLVGAVVALLVARVTGPDPERGAHAGPAVVQPEDCGALRQKPGGGTWTCSFVEEFEGASLDPDTWVLQHTARTGFTVGAACFTGDTNLRVGGGMLHLTATREQPFTCQSPQGDFVTRYRGVDISTWGLFNQAYGRFEARVRLSPATGKGVHSNFWMNPQSMGYGRWPHSGEIDVAEWWSNRPDHAHPSLHYAGRTRDDTGWQCRIGRPDVFHTFAVEWDENEMRFLYDDRLCFRRTWTPDAPLALPQPFDRPFFVSLTQAVGPAPFNQPQARTSFPATMSVDWVKAWRSPTTAPTPGGADRARTGRP